MGTEQILLARIEKLEAANLRLTWVAGIILGLLAAFVVIVTVRTATKKSIEANEFLLRDRDGRIVARLSDKSSGTCFEIVGQAKATSAELCAGDNYGASLSLSNDHGASRAFLSAGSQMLEGSGSVVPSLLIAKHDGKDLVSATIGAETKLVVGHGTEENSFVVSTTESKSTVSLRGSDGKPHWTAP